MKKEELQEIGLTEEQITKVFAMNGADVEREKAKTAQVKADLADAQAQLADRLKDLDNLKKSSGDADGLKNQLEALQAKYDTETERYRTQLAERDYSAALSRAIAKVTSGVKWTSSAAGREFEASMKQQKLSLKDGEIQGAKDFFESWKRDNPDAFAPDKPLPRLVGPIGNGGPPTKTPSRVARIAEEYHNNIYGKVKE